MILAVDIGNTNISIGCYTGKKLIYHLCIDNTSLLNQESILPGKSHLLNESKNIVVASVNPGIESFFYKSLGKKHQKKTLKSRQRNRAENTNACRESANGWH